MRKISVSIRWWTLRITVGLLSPYKIYRQWWKSNIQSTSWSFGCSQSMPPFIFPNSLTHKTYIKYQEELVLMKWVAARRPYIWQQSSTQPGKLSLSCEKLSATTSPLHIWPPNSPDCIYLNYYVWGMVAQEVNETPCETKGKNNSNSYLFKQRIQSERLTGDSEAIWGPWLKPIAISLKKFLWQYFKIFSSNFYKVRCQYYFHFCVI